MEASIKTTPEPGDLPVEETPVLEEKVYDLTTTDGIALLVADTGDARIEEENLPKVYEIVQGILSDAKQVVNAFVTASKRNAQMAQKWAQLRRFVVTPGGPDWKGDTLTYRRLAEDAFSASFEDAKLSKPEKDRVKGAVRQHVKRTFLEAEIRSYVVDTIDGATINPDSPALITGVRNEYKRCDLTIPAKYLSPEEQAARATGGGGPGHDPQSALEAVKQAMAGLPSVTPSYAAMGILVTISQFVALISDPAHGAIQDRPVVGELLSRIALIADYGRKVADVTADPDDRAMALSVMYDKDKDVLDA